jgi:hypothetical protein
MALYRPHHGDVLPRTHHGGGHQSGNTMYQPYPPNIVESKNMFGHTHTQDNGGPNPFSSAGPSFSPTHDGSSSPLQALSSPHLGHVSWYPLGTSFDSIPSNPPLTSSIPPHHPSTALTASPSMSAPPTAVTTAASITPITTPAHSTSQRAKFACTICGKMCTSRPRADTCFFNHMGIKPFACNGDCGVAHW